MTYAIICFLSLFISVFGWHLLLFPLTVSFNNDINEIDCKLPGAFVYVGFVVICDDVFCTPYARLVLLNVLTCFSQAKD